MTDVNFTTATLPTARRLPEAGDFVLFGTLNLYYLVRTGHMNEQNGGLKFIGVDDGNRFSDTDTLDQQIRNLEKSFGDMRIVKKAEIELKF